MKKLLLVLIMAFTVKAFPYCQITGDYRIDRPCQEQEQLQRQVEQQGEMIQEQQRRIRNQQVEQQGYQTFGNFNEPWNRR